ncbi:MAG TPA: hypothetical protein PK295_00355 [Candidatus Magasanikbacteria bacterium]|nr:hypothetical protein [Candidatus Magasanikbacteria bacterium]
MTLERVVTAREARVDVVGPNIVQHLLDRGLIVVDDRCAGIGDGAGVREITVAGDGKLTEH